MKILEFITKYKNGEIKNLRETLAVRDYATFAEKYDLCSSVLVECNTIDEKTGVVVIDSVMRHVVFTITALSLYTNLEFSSDENSETTSIDEYDMLCENKLLELIIDEFAEEYTGCEHMLNTMQNDLVVNSNGIHNIISKIVSQIDIDNLTKELTNK